MTYNVFSGTLNLTQQPTVKCRLHYPVCRNAVNILSSISCTTLCVAMPSTYCLVSVAVTYVFSYPACRNALNVLSTVSVAVTYGFSYPACRNTVNVLSIVGYTTMRVAMLWTYCLVSVAVMYAFSYPVCRNAVNVLSSVGCSYVRFQLPCMS